MCEFTARSGDLDHRFTPSPTAQEGMAGHLLVAERRGEAYLAELPLSGEYRAGPETEDVLVVAGRADGYDPIANRLEEVKTHRGDLRRMAGNQRVLHWAQVRLYGALLCRERKLEEVTLALVYLEIGSGRETVLTERASSDALEVFLAEQCRRFLAWARQEAEHRVRRDTALVSLTFPHPQFRRGQRELAESVYKAASTGRCLMLQAPTGIGKTLGTLFPMLTAMPRQSLDRLFFLTMKTPGRRLALESLATLGFVPHDAPPRDAAGQAELRVLELIARDKACEHPDKACQGDACPLARGFYDRLPVARQAAVTRGWLDREALREVALAHQVCPYYLGQELARWCDLVVGDVNHYFDLNAMLHGLTQLNHWRVGVLVDEAHNLVERARGMFSATLDQQRLTALRRCAPAVLKSALERVSRCWSELGKSVKLHDEAVGLGDVPAYRVLDEPPQRMLNALQQATSAISDYLAERASTDSALQEFLFEALHLCRLAERFGEHSLFDVMRHGRGRAVLTLRNLVPADFLAPRLAATHATVLFSATLSPARYYRDLLGLPNDAPWLEVASPFAEEQLEVRIRSDISTRFSQRDASIAPIIAVLAAQYRHLPGNYLAFFSSFAYLKAVLAHFREGHGDIPVWEQTRGMREVERQAFIDGFVPGGQGIGFAVLGGAFGEGIDLPGDRLIGAFVATLGLPPFDPVNEQLKARLQARFGRGDDYTYRVPGLTKVVQAAGRVIRGPEDRGVVVLMDDRFARGEVRAMLPSWWRVAAT
nr:ATP-dependent DNA helicase [Halomonas populi]